MDMDSCVSQKTSRLLSNERIKNYLTCLLCFFSLMLWDMVVKGAAYSGHVCWAISVPVFATMLITHLFLAAPSLLTHFGTADTEPSIQNSEWFLVIFHRFASDKIY